MKTVIEIERMVFHARHGVMPQELAVGNRFTVSVRVEYPFEPAMRTDDVSDTLNYAILYEIIKEQMIIPSQLLEHIAGRIITAIRQNFPKTGEIWLKITKNTPPISGEMSGVSIEITD